MIRNTMLYHRFWYVRKRNSSKIRIFTRLFLFILTLTIIMTYAEKKIIPYLVDVSEVKAKAYITKTVNNVVSRELIDNKEFEDIIILSKDKNNRVILVQTNTLKINRISSRLSSRVMEELSKTDNENIAIPLGMLLGNHLFESTGPEFNFKIHTYGNVETDFKSEFHSVGVNQTRHAIYLQVKTRIDLAAPFMEKEIDTVTKILVSDTIIVGEMPSLYNENSNVYNQR